MRRNRVIVIVPPNSNTVIRDRLLTVTRPEELSDWSDFLCLGALSLVSALNADPELDPAYVDGTVIDLDEILRHLDEDADHILAVCLGMLSANYEAGLLIAKHAKDADLQITTIAGNDHFSSLPVECMNAAACLDYGFVGNEIVGSFTEFVSALYHQAEVRPAAFPGLVYREAGRVRVVPPRAEPVFTEYDYGLTERLFPHAGRYAGYFGARIAPRIQELIGRTVTAGVPVEIGRGCVKFAADDACSFCAIQHGQLWRNQLTAEEAWQAIGDAWRAGYDYLYLTADELPLTFAQLLSRMASSPPDWWRSSPPDERPLLVGYGRADGIADPRRTALLTSIGIRQVMIGMDAGTPLSLAAMNKPLGGRRRDVLKEAEKLFELNSRAIAVAREHGLLIRAGFVVGHLGMTTAVLSENVERILALVVEGGRSGVFSAVDVEVLSPQPGARDYDYLVEPATAKAAADRLALRIADDDVRAAIAARWKGRDVVEPEDAMRDYTRAFMPELDFETLAAARATIRAQAKACGIVIGE